MKRFTAFVFIFTKVKECIHLCNIVTTIFNTALKLAAIDIGSNAIRLQISTILERGSSPVFKKVEYVRFPLRLGRDVFDLGSISEASQEKFLKLMQTFKMLMDLFEVDSYFACATSAMRTSENGPELAQKVLEQVGLQIEIIDGEQEASFIDLALTESLPAGYCLHIDVGGGSTELNLYQDRRKIASESFSLGSVRNLQGKDAAQHWQALEEWIEDHVEDLDGRVMALGTGGNISKLFNLAGKKPGQSMSLRKIHELRNHIFSFSVEDRIEVLQLNPDRADVIIPASDIYIRIMRWAGCTSILVPNIGLKDGLLRHLYQQQKQLKR